MLAGNQLTCKNTLPCVCACPRSSPPVRPCQWLPACLLSLWRWRGSGGAGFLMRSRGTQQDCNCHTPGTRCSCWGLCSGHSAWEGREEGPLSESLNRQHAAAAACSGATRPDQGCAPFLLARLNPRRSSLPFCGPTSPWLSCPSPVAPSPGPTWCTSSGCEFEFEFQCMHWGTLLIAPPAHSMRLHPQPSYHPLMRFPPAGHPQPHHLSSHVVHVRGKEWGPLSLPRSQSNPAREPRPHLTFPGT